MPFYYSRAPTVSDFLTIIKIKITKFQNELKNNKWSSFIKGMFCVTFVCLLEKFYLKSNTIRIRMICRIRYNPNNKSFVEHFLNEIPEL